MGYSTTGAEGSLVSWGTGGNLYATMLTKLTPTQARWTLVNHDTDISGLGVAFASMLPGLAEWNLALSSYAFAAPRIGNVGTVTLATGGWSYALHVESWEWTWSVIEHDITELASTPAAGPTWMAFRPDGPSTISGKLNMRADSATAGPLPDLVGATLSSLSLVYGDEAADDTLAGSAILKQADYSVSKGQLNTISASFDGTGQWTATGTSSPFGPAGTYNFGIPLWSQGGAAAGAIVMATKTGSRTLSGADSFIRSVTMRCAVGSPVEFTAQIRGTGAVASA